jgi:hypothetical protein
MQSRLGQSKREGKRTGLGDGSMENLDPQNEGSFCDEDEGGMFTRKARKCLTD